VLRMADRTAAAPVAIARAYVTARDAFGLEALNAAIDGLDNRVPGMEQVGLYRAVQDLLVTRTLWFLRNVPLDKGIRPVIAAYGETVAALPPLLDRVLPDHFRDALAEAAARLGTAGVPPDLAMRIARLPAVAAAADIHLVVEATGVPIAEAAPVFFDTADTLRIARIARLAQALPVADYYDGLARDRAFETLAAAHRRIVVEVIAAGGLDQWLSKRGAMAAAVLETVASTADGDAITLSRLTVAANLLADLAAA
jgi:glutamate dehydrogenase